MAIISWLMRFVEAWDDYRDPDWKRDLEHKFCSPFCDEKSGAKMESKPQKWRAKWRAG